MTECFYLFFYDQDVKSLLLEELSFYYPQLKLSFSNKEFISMKGSDGDLEAFKRRTPILSKRLGRFIEKSSIAHAQAQKKGNIESVLVGKEYWIYEVIPSVNDTLDLNQVELPEYAPSRSYHKIEQLIRHFKVSVEGVNEVLEIGSAPGGISYFLLDKGFNLTTIDPAEFDPFIVSHYPKLFHHIKKSFYDVKKAELPEKCDWLITDLNLSGDQSLSHLLRIINYYPSLKMIFLTVKTPDFSEFRKIDKWKKWLSKSSFKVNIFHLPAHRKEVGFYLYKD